MCNGTERDARLPDCSCPRRLSVAIIWYDSPEWWAKNVFSSFLMQRRGQTCIILFWCSRRDIWWWNQDLFLGVSTVTWFYYYIICWLFSKMKIKWFKKNDRHNYLHMFTLLSFVQKESKNMFQATLCNLNLSQFSHPEVWFHKWSQDQDQWYHYIFLYLLFLWN